MKKIGFDNLEIDTLFISGLAKEILFDEFVTDEMIKKAKDKATRISKKLTPEQKRHIIAWIVKERMLYGGNDKMKIRDAINEVDNW